MCSAKILLAVLESLRQLMSYKLALQVLAVLYSLNKLLQLINLLFYYQFLRYQEQ